MQFSSSVSTGGKLTVRKRNHTERAPLSWKLRNMFSRWGWVKIKIPRKPTAGTTIYREIYLFPLPAFIRGWLAAKVVSPVATGFGLTTVYAELELRKRVFYHDAEREYYLSLLRAGKVEEAETYAVLRTYWIDYGVVSYRVVTDAFAAYLVDDLDNGAGSADISLFNFHGIGTNNTAEAASDTALGAESTTALNPDSTRATGTRSQPAANQYRTTGTLTADGAIAAVEHGLFTQAATGGGTLADRSVYSTVNIAAGESLQCQYTMTVNSGG